MKDTIPAVTPPRPGSRRPQKRASIRCSICTSHIWFHAISLCEPEGAPEPRHTWTLCKSCHRALLIEMHRSPVRSPLRLRIAMGIVAAERSPQAYSSRFMNDRMWIIILAWGFGIAMILHLILIVMIASIAR